MYCEHHFMFDNFRTVLFFLHFCFFIFNFSFICNCLFYSLSLYLQYVVLLSHCNVILLTSLYLPFSFLFLNWKLHMRNGSCSFYNLFIKWRESTLKHFWEYVLRCFIHYLLFSLLEVFWSLIPALLCVCAVLKEIVLSISIHWCCFQ